MDRIHLCPGSRHSYYCARLKRLRYGIPIDEGWRPPWPVTRFMGSRFTARVGWTLTMDALSVMSRMHTKRYPQARRWKVSTTIVPSSRTQQQSASPRCTMRLLAARSRQKVWCSASLAPREERCKYIEHTKCECTACMVTARWPKFARISLRIALRRSAVAVALPSKSQAHAGHLSEMQPMQVENSGFLWPRTPPSSVTHVLSMCSLDSALLQSYAHPPADADDSALRRHHTFHPYRTLTRIGSKKRIAETKVGQGQSQSRCPFPERTSSPVRRGKAGELARSLRETWMGTRES